jgi:plastocyanin
MDVGCGSSGGSSLLPGINGCTSSSFTSASDAGTATINFGGGLGNNYNPKCLAVAHGRPVTWMGDFGVHPLRQGLAPSQQGGPDAGSPNSPIQSTSSGSTATFTFPTPGVYPYFCSAHESQGMFGAVEVL